MTDAERAAGGAEPKSGFGRGFLYDLWYFADLGAALKPGRLQRYEILGQPILLGRTRAGQVYALRDICPHRAAPLSAGKLVDEPGNHGSARAESVQCPYHGWRFATADECGPIQCENPKAWSSSIWPRTRAGRLYRPNRRRSSQALWGGSPS